MSGDALDINYAPKYNKIQNLFRRSPEHHGIVPGEFGSPVFEYLKHAKWLVQEKIDGTNVRIIWDGNRVSFGGKNTLDPKNLPGRLRSHLEETYGTPEFEQVIEQVFGETPVTLYGEGYGHKIQTGADYFPDEPEGRNEFIGFDARVDGRYVSAENTADILNKLGMPMVARMPEPMSIPEVMAYLISGIEFAKNHGGPAISHRATNKEIEGVVLRSVYPLYDHRGNRVMTKIILSDVRKVIAEQPDETVKAWLLG